MKLGGSSRGLSYIPALPSPLHVAVWEHCFALGYQSPELLSDRSTVGLTFLGTILILQIKMKTMKIPKKRKALLRVKQLSKMKKGRYSYCHQCFKLLLSRRVTNYKKILDLN